MASTRLAVPALLIALLSAWPVAAQTPRSPQVFDQFASPFTDSEIGGIGCAVATVAAGAGIVAAMGGPVAVGVALHGILTPRAVLEASAASAFVASSACYVGQAMAPVVLLGWLSLLDSLSGPVPPLPVNPDTGHSAGLSANPAGGGQGDSAALP
jgi:hypothetical protein